MPYVICACMVINFAIGVYKTWLAWVPILAATGYLVITIIFLVRFLIRSGQEERASAGRGALPARLIQIPGLILCLVMLLVIAFQVGFESAAEEFFGSGGGDDVTGSWLAILLITGLWIVLIPLEAFSHSLTRPFVKVYWVLILVSFLAVSILVIVKAVTRRNQKAIGQGFMILVVLAELFPILDLLGIIWARHET